MKEHSLSALINQKSIKFLFKIFESASKEICLVGGCIRDALLDKEARDIDIAANANPNVIIQILNNNNLKYEDYAYKYGSITTFIEGQKFQITSLREDVNQLGRHTNIIYTNDWKKDAARRDFTINAMYLTSNGKLKDYFNGQEDLIDNTIRFIGNIEDSIQEDFLRIFRYYRFLGIFAEPNLIKGYDKILSQHLIKSFNFLSNDLVRQEILKMFHTSFPINSFFNTKNKIRKKYWITLTKKHFIKTEYEIGLNKCLNKIDLLIN